MTQKRNNKRITGTVENTASTLTMPLPATKHCDEIKNTNTRLTILLNYLILLPSHDQDRYVCLEAFRLNRFYFAELGTSMFV
jgi:hypothetical protein